MFLGEIQLAAGTHQYSFQCYLPTDLPSSVEGEFGYIRYQMTVVFEVAFWPEQEFITPFTVIKPLNLNDSPMLRVI